MGLESVCSGRCKPYSNQDAFPRCKIFAITLVAGGILSLLAGHRVLSANVTATFGYKALGYTALVIGVLSMTCGCMRKGTHRASAGAGREVAQASNDPLTQVMLANQETTSLAQNLRERLNAISEVKSSIGGMKSGLELAGMQPGMAEKPKDLAVAKKVAVSKEFPGLVRKLQAVNIDVTPVRSRALQASFKEAQAAVVKSLREAITELVSLLSEQGFTHEEARVVFMKVDPCDIKTLAWNEWLKINS